MKTNVDYYFLVPLRGKNRVLLSKEEEEKATPTIFLGGVVEYNDSGAARVCVFETDEDRQKYGAGPWDFLPRISPDYDPQDLPEEFPLSVGISYCNLGAERCPENPHMESESQYRLVRFLLQKYGRRKLLRNNTADIYERYGELWRERSPMLSAFKFHYEEYIGPFDEAIDELYDLYQKRYIHNEYANTTPLRHAILKKIKLFQQRKNWDDITRNNIYSIVFRNFGSKLYKI